jgi:hypothetical protein
VARTCREVKLFALLQKASLRSEKRMCDRLRGDGAGEEGADTFFALIEQGRADGADESQVWSGHGCD